MLDLKAVLVEWNPRYLSNTNEYRIMCPYRENHNPISDGAKSGFIIPDKNLYHCFSCGVTVNLLEMLTGSLFGVPFNDAYEMVVVDNIDYLLNGKQKTDPDAIDILIPTAVSTTFKKRGFSERLLRQFKVGEENGVIYIPIYDKTGKELVGVKCRKDRNFWYVPKNFNKGSYMYNFHNCIGQDFCILVEGETDTYASCKNGFWNTCSQMGGVLDDEQVKLIVEQKFKYVVTAFDNDAAGFKDTETAYNKLSPYVDVRVAMYVADDPGACEKETWEEAIVEAGDYAEYSASMAMILGNNYFDIKKLSKK